jgi:hypothetical protein
MGGPGEELPGVADLDEPARLHDADDVGDLRDHREVRDVQQAERALALDVPELPDDPVLDDDVERRGRLVGDHERGVGGERHGDDGALLHAAAVLVRIPLDPIGR